MLRVASVWVGVVLVLFAPGSASALECYANTAKTLESPEAAATTCETERAEYRSQCLTDPEINAQDPGWNSCGGTGSVEYGWWFKTFGAVSGGVATTYYHRYLPPQPPPEEDPCPENGTPGPTITHEPGSGSDFCSDSCAVYVTGFSHSEFSWGTDACWHVVGDPPETIYCDFTTEYSGEECSGEPTAGTAPSGEPESGENTCPENYAWNGESCEASDANNPQPPSPETTTTETTTETTENPDGSTTTTTSETTTHPNGSTTEKQTTVTNNIDGSTTTNVTNIYNRGPGGEPNPNATGTGDGEEPAKEPCDPALGYLCADTDPWGATGERTGFDLAGAQAELDAARTAFGAALDQIQGEAQDVLGVSLGAGPGALPCWQKPLSLFGSTRTLELCPARYESELAIVAVALVALSMIAAAFIVLR